MSDLILHHYDISPYAEKIRTTLDLLERQLAGGAPFLLGSAPSG